MMKAGDKMITCGTSPSSHIEKVKMAVFESENDANRKWKQLLTYGTSHTLHLWAYSPESNSFLSEFDTFLYFFYDFLLILSVTLSSSVHSHIAAIFMQ